MGRVPLLGHRERVIARLPAKVTLRSAPQLVGIELLAHAPLFPRHVHHCSE